jgi:hypothetical protein
MNLKSKVIRVLVNGSLHEKRSGLWGWWYMTQHADVWLIGNVRVVG